MRFRQAHRDRQKKPSDKRTGTDKKPSPAAMGPTKETDRKTPQELGKRGRSRKSGKEVNHKETKNRSGKRNGTEGWRNGSIGAGTGSLRIADNNTCDDTRNRARLGDDITPIREHKSEGGDLERNEEGLVETIPVTLSAWHVRTESQVKKRNEVGTEPRNKVRRAESIESGIGPELQWRKRGEMENAEKHGVRGR